MTDKSYDFCIINKRLEIYLLAVWPLLLTLTWVLLLILARISNVFHNIPEDILARYGITHTISSKSLGFIQDRFYSIWQFFWIPLVFTAAYAFRMVPRMVIHFVNLSKEDPASVLIPEGFDKLLTQIQRRLYSKWQWLAAIGGGIIAILIQLNIQIDRIANPEIIYWWDWRINKSIYIIRLIMVGVDIFFAVIIFYRGTWAVIFIRRFLKFIKVTPRPLHPDRAGGLSIVGKTCLSYTWPLFVIGVVLATSFLYHVEATYIILNIITLVAYVVCITFVFFFPLSSVHMAMKQAKEACLNNISIEINKLLHKLDQIIKCDDKDPEPYVARIDHLKKYYDTVQSMPVWPYDLATLSRFFSSILIPVLIVIAQAIFQAIMQ